MQQIRQLPSALLTVLALSATACGATTLESAAAHDAAPAPAIDVVRPSPETATTPAPTTTNTVPPTTTTMPPSTQPPPDTTTVPSTTVPPTTTEAPEPVPTIPPVLTAGPCGPVGAIPDSAAGVMSIDLDVAGDGIADDVATSYLDGDTGEWKVRLVTAAGTVSEQVIDGVDPGFVEVLGAVEFGTTGADSFLATVGSTPSAFRLGLFGADATGCLIRHGGDDVEFAVGGSIGELRGVRCDSWNGHHFLESLSAPGADGVYNVYGTIWFLGDDGEAYAEDGSHIVGAPADKLHDLAEIDCPGFDS